jgi:alkaline phosphatase D
MRRRTLLQSLAIGLTTGAITPLLGRAQDTRGYMRLFQGPMVGATTPTSISLWMRAANAADLVVEYGTDPTLATFTATSPVAVSAAEDYTATINLRGLLPSTTYFYRVKVGGDEDRYLGAKPPFAVRTPPPAGAKGRLRIAFGSCARVQAHPEQPVWDAVKDADPDLFLWLGDNVYHDTLEPRIMDEMWRWQRRVPGLERFQRHVSQLAIWDDHDYALNNSDRTNPVKELALASFKRHWANPAYGLPGAPGVFFRHAVGDVELFMLDGRWNRAPAREPDGPGKTKLGAAQKAWLLQGLKASRATFKIIAAGGGWTVAKGPAGDAWSAFMTERNEIFDFIAREGVTGVVLLSGDTHVGELNAIPWSDRGGYDLYELVSSPLAQDRRTSWLERRPELRMREVYVGDNNFGVIDVDTTKPDPTITLNLMDTRGNAVWSPLTLALSDLRPGVRSWERKIGALSRDRLRQVQEGKDYYHPDLRRD